MQSPFDPLDDLIDIGVNLGHDSFDADRDEVMTAARDAGVARMVVTGADVEGSEKAAALAGDHPGCLFSTAGMHPHYARDFDDSTIGAFKRLLDRPDVVAVGECGLDHFRNFSTPQQQDVAFEAQLALACELSMPVFLHQRDAHDRFIAILKPWRDRIPGAVAHCFTGTDEELSDCLELDLYVGITGWICDERRGTHLRQVVREIPADRLMVETDAPYLLPRDLKPRPRTRRNEPRHLRHVLETVAECVGRPAAQVAAETTANARRFFTLP